jgi:hypothetical protein
MGAAGAHAPSTQTDNGGFRRFSVHWGAGVIEEEIRVRSKYHQPAIQLLRFTEGAAEGSNEIRFCYYGHSGQFQRSPLIIGEDDLPRIRQALRRTPKLHDLLKRMI